MLKKLVLILFIVIVFLLGLFLGGLFLQSKNPSPNPSTQTQATSSVLFSTAGWQKISDVKNGFEISYPNEAKVSRPNTETPDWRSDNGTPAVSGITAAEITIPSILEPNTNFREARFHVGVSTSPGAITSCLVPEQGENTTTSIQKINGNTFTVFDSSGAAAGNRYKVTSYRIVHGNRCYALDLTIHSTVLENYDPSFGYHEFDPVMPSKLLEAMLGSFKFL